MPANGKLMLGLSSGAELIASRVMLFPAAEIREILSLRTMAQEQLGGGSTGLGIWGSSGWAIAGTIVLGLAEAMESNSRTKKGLQLLRDVANKTEELKLN